jgi:chaperonin GroES
LYSLDRDPDPSNVLVDAKHLSAMTIIPLEDRILVRPAETLSEHGRTNTTVDDAAKRPMRGTVIAVGTGTVDSTGRSTSPPVQAGDIILFAPHLGSEVTFGGVQYWMMKAADIVEIEVRAVSVELYGAKRLLRSKQSGLTTSWT